MNKDDLKFRVWDNEEKCYQESDADYCRINYNGELECMFTYDNGIGCRYEYIQDRCSIERCTGFTDNYEIPIYEKDRIKIEDPIKGIKQDTEYCVGWTKGCWYALGAHGMQRLSELLENHSVLVLGSIHDKEKNEQKENIQ